MSKVKLITREQLRGNFCHNCGMEYQRLEQDFWDSLPDSPEQKVCEWKHVDLHYSPVWIASCNKEETETDVRRIYCPYCGGKIVEGKE